MVSSTKSVTMASYWRPLLVYHFFEFAIRTFIFYFFIMMGLAKVGSRWANAVGWVEGTVGRSKTRGGKVGESDEEFKWLGF